MKVVSITPRGYCKGVTKAIEAVKNAYHNPKIQKPIYVLGYIVHNKHVIDDLTKLGIITLDDSKTSRLDLIDSIKSGTVILSAHGTAPKVKEKLSDLNLNYIDATCEDVVKTFDLIKKYSNENYHIFYIGKKHHPEANAALSLTEGIDLIENINSIPKGIRKPIFVTNQTTFSHIEIDEIINAILAEYPDTLISEEICNATEMRQRAIINSNKGVDLCYIVGDPRSNNTRNLAIISENITKTKTILIESASDIIPEDLERISVISVSSGASTPNYLTKEVIEFLKNYDNKK